MAKQQLEFSAQVLNAAGALGFAPDERAPVDWGRLGAFVTNPVSHRRRLPAENAAQIDYPGGTLLHSGLPNPGIKAALRRHARAWGQSALPVIPHLLADDADSLRGMVEQLEEAENILAVEIGVRDDIEESAFRAMVSAALGELPLIAQCPLGRAFALGAIAVEAGANCVSLAAPRGTLPDGSGALVEGRLYGPAVFPLALGAVRDLAAQGVPVIGGGGVYEMEQVEQMLAAGALAVQVDLAFWRGMSL
jgi:dihydroorotate dehydrogenase (NAD+) catalytic subunit